MRQRRGSQGEAAGLARPSVADALAEFCSYLERRHGMSRETLESAREEYSAELARRAAAVAELRRNHLSRLVVCAFSHAIAPAGAAPGPAQVSRAVVPAFASALSAALGDRAAALNDACGEILRDPEVHELQESAKWAEVLRRGDLRAPGLGVVSAVASAIASGSLDPKALAAAVAASVGDFVGEESCRRDFDLIMAAVLNAVLPAARVGALGDAEGPGGWAADLDRLYESIPGEARQAYELHYASRLRAAREAGEAELAR
jgi:hypothetical protein